MVELSSERIDRILHEETAKKEELQTILRSIYTRYMRLYEKYFDDIEALNEGEIDQLRTYHEETRSLIRYYYMDIPQDICMGLIEFENRYSAKLLGPEWHQVLSASYEEFRENIRNRNKSEESLKADFKKESLSAFYDAMDLVFREGFNTGSQTTKKVLSGITGLLFGK